MLLQYTTEKGEKKCKCFYNIQLKKEKWNANASTLYNWKTKNEIQILLQSTTKKRKKKCNCFYNLQLKD